MAESYVSFNEIEDDVATFVLYTDDPPRELLYYPIDDLPPGVERDQLGCKFRPEFDDDGDIVALHYDEELTQRKHEQAKAELEEFEEMLNDNE
jgi:hypothetical protein